MNIHYNARLTPLGRERMVRAIVEGGQTPQAAARAAGVCPRTARKWVARFKAEGLAGLADRSSRPQRLRQPTSPAVVDQVIALRRQRLPGQHIAKAAGVSPATVSRILKRAGLSRLRDLEPPEPVRRYERQHPGELIHIDIKKLGRFHQVGHRITGDRRGQSNARSRGEGAGWEFVHVCIDDASRIAFTMIMPDEKAKSAIAFLKAAVAYYNRPRQATARPQRKPKRKRKRAAEAVPPTPPRKMPKRKHGGGRKPSLTPEQIRNGIAILRNKPKMTIEAARAELRGAGIEGSDSALYRLVVAEAYGISK